MQLGIYENGYMFSKISFFCTKQQKQKKTHLIYTNPHKYWNMREQSINKMPTWKNKKHVIHEHIQLIPASCRSASVQTESEDIRPQSSVIRLRMSSSFTDKAQAVTSGFGSLNCVPLEGSIRLCLIIVFRSAFFSGGVQLSQDYAYFHGQTGAQIFLYCCNLGLNCMIS